MKVAGKFKQNFSIEYEISNPEIRYYDNEPKITVDYRLNKKQFRAYKKGFKLTAKYLARMKRLGFEPVEQEAGRMDIHRI